ncbi:MAG TPA: DNA endonuclease SmrA [Spongiibacteraceae bacterium]|nr:DNA endonuclease SmrA [Spongiibacteraceae bacterium]HCS26587.1 DNA endonuclease SmrA [Spongiibacteraceae bacterium]|tara:strand:+ start:1414 stop:1998 length:585 start_codon:yes stop_codon:yes gene_type:complete
MQDDDKLFANEFGDVKPLKVEERVSIRRQDISALAKAARREAATSERVKDANFLSDAEIPLLDAHYTLSYQGAGVQHGVFRKLKQGSYEHEARLDLHRMTVEQARREVFSFINEAEQLSLRSLLIVHGKGLGSQAQGAVLKSYLNAWLPQLPSVLAYVSAQPRHGGVGAVYVLLKKSTEKKQENRIRFNRGREE